MAPVQPAVSSLLRFLLCIGPLVALAAAPPNPAPWQFQVSIDKGLPPAKEGRLFVILAPRDNPEPRLALGRTGLDAPEALARDVNAFAPGIVAVLDQTAFAYPLTNLSALPTGDYFAQALFDCNADLRFTAAPGNLYSKPQQIHFGHRRFWSGGTHRRRRTRQARP